MRSRWAFPALLISLIATSCSRGPADHSNRKVQAVERAVPVKIYTVSQRDAAVLWRGVGTVEALEKATLSARVMGYVAEVTADAGDRVHSGQVLVRLRVPEVRARVEQAKATLKRAEALLAQARKAKAAAKAQLELAKSRHQRILQLVARGSASEFERDQVVSQLEVATANYEAAALRVQEAAQEVERAQAAVREVEASERDTRIEAPFEAVVAERFIDPGDLARPGIPLLVLEKVGRYRLVVGVDESLSKVVRAGSLLKYSIDGIGAAGQLRISEVIPVLDPQTRTFLVRANLPGIPGLRSGMFARVELVVGKRAAIYVPQTAVQRHGQLSWVFVVEDGRAKRRLILPGQRDGEFVEVLSGLQAGEQIVVHPPTSIQDGSLVKIVQQ